MRSQQIIRRKTSAGRAYLQIVESRRAQHHGFGRKARTRAHQPFQLAARLQVLETPERRDHLLTHLVAVAAPTRRGLTCLFSYLAHLMHADA